MNDNFKHSTGIKSAPQHLDVGRGAGRVSLPSGPGSRTHSKAWAWIIGLLLAANGGVGYLALVAFASAQLHVWALS